jgi:predicted TIM-barrel fold metal-dependent hydrolase
VWTWPFESLLDTARSASLGATTLPDVLALVESTMETAANNGCRGFKNGSAYRRSYELAPVTPQAAGAALRELLAAGTAGTSEKTAAARAVYEDFLFKHIYLTAGKLDVPIVMHMAVAHHPLLRAEFNDASALFDVFHDEDVLRAGTRFVIRNTGYPAHHIVSSIISQFPNVYTDVAYFSQYPGVLAETYRVLLAVGPSDKIMHGSDVAGVPEGIGYCAWNTRHVLAQILRDYRTHFGWSMTEIERMAENILHANARKVYRISRS